MPTDFMSLFAALNAGGARFVIVGGLASILHGVDRTTADVDIILDLAAESARAAIVGLIDAGYRPMAPVDPLGFADIDSRTRWQREHGMQVFSMWDSENRRPTVDILLESVVPFAALWSDAVEMTFRGATVKVASIEHMVSERNLHEAPQGWGSFEDAETLRHWSFLQRTPQQRLDWLTEMLELAYASGARKPRRPDAADPASTRSHLRDIR